MFHRIVIIDNFDSFTYNLYHYIIEFNKYCDVIRTDQVNIESLKEYQGIIFSPGPGSPDDYPILTKILDTYKNYIPVFGICLGMQIIGKYFGCTLKNLQQVYHGKEIQTTVTDKNDILFKDIPGTFPSGRYHSWCIEKPIDNNQVIITAMDEINDIIMAIRHKTLSIHGVQFHPESIMTHHGKRMIVNWLNSL